MRDVGEPVHGVLENEGGVMFAVITTGGKQYRVAEGDQFLVEKLELEPGAALEFDSLFSFDGALKNGVKVKAQVVRHVRGKKIYIDKYKSGIQYRRRNGHRQHYTEIKVTSIL